MKNGSVLGQLQIKHDGALSIAVGASRKELHWKNKNIQWSNLLKKLSTTKRTAETFTEYMKASKSSQDSIKDVGGFIGGILKDGKRKSQNIQERSMLTLDADFSTGRLWETYTLMYDCSACIYSTHKHTPDKHRLRLVIPLKRSVDPEEYEAIARKVAEAVGIDEFDDTTYEPSRLMYWPSTPSDGEYTFEHQDGEWLDPDKVLSEYADWKNTSSWPISSRTKNQVHDKAKRAEDPTEKMGLIGAFCRAYDIHEAIDTFLTDKYEKCDLGKDRYTFKGGSTSGGLIAYEDKWTFSHHGTDPTSGKLCNAFDLVRIHLFGELDDKAKEGTPASRAPSYIAMAKFVSSDERTKRQIFKEHMDEAKKDFGEELEEISEENTDWISKLTVEKNGKYSQTVENAQIILENDPDIVKADLKKNEFRQTFDVLGRTPWEKSDLDLKIWSDSDTNNLYAYMEKRWGMTSERVIMIARNVVFNKRRYHPVRDYLNSLQWDGIKRVDTLFMDYLGAEDNIFVRAATRKFLVAAVARVFEPGCKFDYVPVLVGAQGIGKSVTAQSLGCEWFSDNFALSGRGDKKDVEQLLGVWIMEIQELAGLYGKNADAVKSFISTCQDEVRLAFRAEKGYFPRQCVFLGTTNNLDFLTDTTGNRRFWPITVGKTKPTKNFYDLHLEVDQLWAEALGLYKSGEPLYLEDPKVEKMAKEIQEWHREADSWEDTINEFLDTLVPSGWNKLPLHERALISEFGEDADKSDWVLRDQVTIEEIWRYALGESKTPNCIDAKRIKKIIRRLPEWTEKQIWVKGDSQKGKNVRGFLRIN